MNQTQKEARQLLLRLVCNILTKEEANYLLTLYYQGKIQLYATVYALESY